MIEIIHEKDGSQWYNYSVINHGLVPVLNEDGIVVINDTIFQYTSDRIKILCNGDYGLINELKKTDHSNPDKNIKVVNFSPYLKSTASVNYGNNPSWIEKPGSNHLRAKFVVVCEVADPGNQNSQNVNFYIEAIAQEKRFFKWKTRNSYMPIDNVYASWSYDVSCCPPNSFNCITSLSSSYPSSPFSYNFDSIGGSNHCQFYLHPNGFYPAPYGYHFASGVYFWSGSFSADVRGYNGIFSHTF